MKAETFKKQLFARLMREQVAMDNAGLVMQFIDAITRKATRKDGSVNEWAVQRDINAFMSNLGSDTAPQRPASIADDYHTFGDYLVEHDYPLHSGTVIMDATAVNREMYRREQAGEPPINRAALVDQICLPPYDQLLLEWRDTADINNELPSSIASGVIAVWQAARLSRVEDDAFWLYAMYLRADGTLVKSHAPVEIMFDAGRYVDDQPTQPDPTGRNPATYLPNNFTRQYVGFAMWALSLLHQKVDVEQVSLKRGPRRRYEKQHGKQPSPYFRFRDIRPGEPGSASGEGQPSGRTMPVHTVRGHFRHYQDGKVVWIRPHVRGQRGSGGVQDRPYRIVLPKTN